MNDHRPFTDHLQRQANDPGASAADLSQLAKRAQEAADWLQSQAAEAQRLAARLRRKVRGKA